MDDVAPVGGAVDDGPVDRPAGVAVSPRPPYTVADLLSPAAMRRVMVRADRVLEERSAAVRRLLDGAPATPRTKARRS